MKHLRFPVLATALLLSIQSARAVDKLTVEGDLAITGNTASFGTEGTGVGFNLLYTAGNPSMVGFNATSAGASWAWRQGSGNTQMSLSNTNLLSLFPVNSTIARIILNPASVNGATNEFIKLISSTNADNTAQRIAGYGDVLNGYIDFKRFDDNGPTTGLTLGTYAGDVLTIRSGGSWDSGSVGIGTTLPGAKLEVVGNAKVTGAFTSLGTITAPAITLPDGSTLTTARVGTLQTSTGTSVATVSSTGTTSFSNTSDSISAATGAVQVAGGIGVGGSSYFGKGLFVQGGWEGSGAAFSRGVLLQAGNQGTGSTSAIEAINAGITTAAGTYTTADVRLLNLTGNISKGSGHTITNATGVAIPNISVGTNNVNLLVGQSSSPAGNFSIYNSSGLTNFFQGKLGLGPSMTGPTHQLEVNGNAKIGGPLGVMAGASTESYLQIGLNGGSSLVLNTFQIRGIDLRPVNSGNGGVVGVFAWPIQSLNPIGPAGDVVAFQGKVRAAGGYVTNGKGFEVLTPDINSPSTITNIYGLYINSQKVTGSTNAFGVYQAAATDLNYFAGNIGVGTTVPAEKLEVKNGRVRVSSDASGANIYGEFYQSGESTVIRLNHPGPWGAITLDTGGSTSYSFLQNPFGSSSFAGMQSNSPDRHFAIINGSTTAGIGLHTAGNSTARLFVNSAGNVGIGTMSPAEKLDVVGNAKVSGTLTVGGNAVATTNQLSGYVTTTGSGAGLTNLNAGALATGMIPTAVLPATVTQLGSSIDLSTAEATGNLAWNRVDKTTANLTDLPARAFADLQSKPTTLSGYGITDAVEKDASGNVAIAGTSTLNGAVAVNAVATFNRRVAKLRIEPQGDIDMGDFTAGSEIP